MPEITEPISTSHAAKPPTYDSFAALYAATRDSVHAYVLGVVRDRHAAEEVVALVFERAWRRRDRIDPSRGDARTWLFGIARNAALDELRRLRRHAAPTESSVLARLAGQEPVDDEDQRLDVRSAVAALPAGARELVALKFWSGLNNREIAAVTGLSESNVGTRLSRIIRDLRSTL
jgi:RNA polymerase sigma-70 factor (ECF subfamily)